MSRFDLGELVLFRDAYGNERRATVITVYPFKSSEVTITYKETRRSPNGGWQTTAIERVVSTSQLSKFLP